MHPFVSFLSSPLPKEIPNGGQQLGLASPRARVTRQDLTQQLINTPRPPWDCKMLFGALGGLHGILGVLGTQLGTTALCVGKPSLRGLGPQSRLRGWQDVVEPGLKPLLLIPSTPVQPE